MSWRPIDFEGMIQLGDKVVEQLELYLAEKEARLAREVILLIEPQSLSADNPFLPISSIFIRLSEAVESFTKRVRGRKASEKSSAKESISLDPSVTVFQLNSLLWELTEVLEGAVVELFQQVEQISIEKWGQNFAHVVNQIKELLSHRIEDLIWIVRRLKEPIQEFSKDSFSRDSLWQKILHWDFSSGCSIDSDLLKNLKQCQKYLLDQYEAFEKRYRDLQEIIQRVQPQLDKLQTFPCIVFLDSNDRSLYVQLYRLLSLLQENAYQKGVLARDTARSIKFLGSAETTFKMFKQYLKNIKELFFRCSHEEKRYDLKSASLAELLEQLKLKVDRSCEELSLLISTISQYRNFLLKNDPNPYARLRLGFSETRVAPETGQTQKFVNLIFTAEELAADYRRLSSMLVPEMLATVPHPYAVHLDLEKILHEMGQPLISREMMASRAHMFVELLRSCDEVCSPYEETISYVSEILSKGMREDWKYHVLHSLPHFHHLFRLHLGLVGEVADPSHAFRMEKFRHFIELSDSWLEKGELDSHLHEEELNIHDIKGYLQDFLGSVQRMIKERSGDPEFVDEVAKYRSQLLDYRYLFGQFFYRLMSGDVQWQQLRKQCLFVDQYFEAVDRALYDGMINIEEKKR